MAAVASAQANRQMTIKMKQKLAAEHHKEKLKKADMPREDNQDPKKEKKEGLSIM